MLLVIVLAFALNEYAAGRRHKALMAVLKDINAAIAANTDGNDPHHAERTLAMLTQITKGAVETSKQAFIGSPTDEHPGGA